MKRLSKKGNIGSTGMKVAFGIIGVVVLMEIVAGTYSTLTSAGSTLNASGIPLGTLFLGGGVLTLILAAGVLIAAIRGVTQK